MDKRSSLVDPMVSKIKFKREIAAYRRLEDQYIRQGWWLVKAEFPLAFVVFGTPKLKPPSLAFGVIIDFTGYDFAPPSVRMVDPFTQEPYSLPELPNTLLRQAVAPQVGLPPGFMLAVQPQSLMQAHEGGMPFLCVPGILEYHEHPAHTGDSWWLHRGLGEGTLHFILNTFYKYGVVPVSGYNVELRPSVVGFRQEAVPE